MTDSILNSVVQAAASGPTAVVADSPERRDFLKTTAGATGGLLMAFAVPFGAGPVRAAATVYTPNAWVHIADDSTITLISARAEMGQGVFTSMPMLIAEELNVNPKTVRIAFAPPDKAYGNQLIFGLQLTGGSTSVREGWDRQRLAGAQVREMLVAAAAKKWNVAASDCRAENAMVVGPGGRRETYGNLAADAAKLPVPAAPAMKKQADFRVVGKRMGRLDTPDKVNGKAGFGIDVKLPGMLYASLEQGPVQGGKVKSFDASAAKAMPGVVDVVQIPDGVAVVADSYWRAVKARKAVKIVWDEGANATLSTADMFGRMSEALKNGTPIVAKKHGDPDALIAQSKQVHRAQYRTQMVSHAPMEPMNYTAHFQGDKIRLVGPTQWPDAVQGTIAKILGLKPENVTVENTFLGGAFGRRIDFDYIIQAALISKAVNKPVKLVWSREDDTQHDFYRPLAIHDLAASVDVDGKPVALTWRVASQSIMGRVFGLPAKDLDVTMVEAAVPMYQVAAARHDTVKADGGVRVGFWRAVSHNMNVFANESFFDELAVKAKADPIAYRRSMLDEHPRMQKVLDRLADAADWMKAPPSGRHRGVACFEGYGTYIGGVMEVSMEDGAPKVHKITIVADCGSMVNPDTVEAQIQSSVVYGLSAALWGEITVDKGRIQQHNFDDYRVMRMHEMPELKIVLMDSTEAPGGMGEPATSLMAPALANAVFAATGKRVREMPLTAERLRKA